MSRITRGKGKVRRPLDKLCGTGPFEGKDDPCARRIPEHAAKRATLAVQLGHGVVAHAEARGKRCEHVFFCVGVKLGVDLLCSIRTEDGR